MADSLKSRTEAQSASDYDAALRRVRDRGNGVKVKRYLNVSTWPLQEWITSRDLARELQVKPSMIHCRLYHRKDVERKIVSVHLVSNGRAFVTRITAWRWKK